MNIHAGFTSAHVLIGGGSPVSIQSMTNTATTDVKGTIAQIEELEKAGCDIVRISIPDEDSLKAFGKIKKGIRLPLIADIHFDHRLAIGAIAQGADGIRINPGNIGGKERLKAVAKASIERKIPIRVGVNLGSVKRSLLAKYADDHVGALIENARQYVEMLEDMGVESMKVSLKSSDVYRDHRFIPEVLPGSILAPSPGCDRGRAAAVGIDPLLSRYRDAP